MEVRETNSGRGEPGGGGGRKGGPELRRAEVTVLGIFQMVKPGVANSSKTQ